MIIVNKLIRPDMWLVRSRSMLSMWSVGADLQWLEVSEDEVVILCYDSC